MKGEGKFAFGQVPALEVTNKEKGNSDQLVQSGSILRFISKLIFKNNFYPRCPVTAGKVDAILDQEADAFAAYRTIHYKDRNGFKDMTPEDQSKFKQVINDEVIPAQFEKLCALLQKSETGWLAGTSGPSIADFHWVATLMAIQRGWTGNKEALKKFPELVGLVEKFLAVPEIADYYKNNEFKIWW